jgi:hypothetical protein
MRNLCARLKFVESGQTIGWSHSFAASFWFSRQSDRFSGNWDCKDGWQFADGKAAEVFAFVSLHKIDTAAFCRV